MSVNQRSDYVIMRKKSSLFDVWSILIYPVLFFLFFIPLKGHSQKTTDTELKVAYTFNFTKYITWKNESTFSNFQIIQLGSDNTLFKELSQLSRYKAKEGKSITVTQAANLSKINISSTRIIYVTTNQSVNLSEILDKIRGTNILLVSDNATMYKSTMINFLTNKDGRVEIEVNTKNINNQQLIVSPEIVVMGGTNMDVAKVYEESLAEEKEKVKDQEERIVKQQEEIKKQEDELVNQKQEILNQEQKITFQKKKINKQVVKINEQDKRLLNQQKVLEEGVEDLKILSIKLDKREEIYKGQLSRLMTQREEIKSSEKRISDYNTLMEDQEGEIEQQKKNISSQQKRIDVQQTVLIFSFISLFLALISGFLVYRNNKFKKKANLKLQEKNKALEFQKIKITEQSETIKQNAILHEQFLANTSHELRTPMNAIKGFVDLINESDSTDKKKEYLEYIKLSALNVLTISNDILDISKIESGKIVFEKIPFSLNYIVNNAIKINEVKANERNLVLKVNWKNNNPGFLIGDPTRLSQIFINLLTNAIKFTKVGGVIMSIDWVPQLVNGVKKIELFVEVKDTGIGITEDRLDYIFEKFTQSGSDINRKYGGTGLGLPITKQLVELQQGTINVESELGKGSVFSFFIPYEISTKKQLVDEVSKFEDYSEYKWLNNLKVLMVDDNHLNRIMAKETLMSMNKNILLDIANNGKKAIDMFKEHDVIFMDLHMPLMDGIETTEYIRANLKGGQQVYIVGTSVTNSKKEKEACSVAGMNDYISKPFKKEEILLMAAKSLKISLDKKNISEETQTEKLMSVKESLVLQFPDKKDQLDVANILLDEIPEELENIQNSYDLKDWKRFIDAIHSINNKSSYTGSLEFKTIAQKIEKIARGDKNEKEIEGLLTKKTQVWDKLKEEIETFIKMNKK
ncbi:MAG: hypothetical protein COB15_06015 [Flavobacteriales bacterium]|nr:MAG: hypothetical protein COB15_06015 [Flavobacteriales bacterium]